MNGIFLNYLKHLKSILLVIGLGDDKLEQHSDTVAFSIKYPTSMTINKILNNFWNKVILSGRGTVNCVSFFRTDPVTYNACSPADVNKKIEQNTIRK
jgi:hypothetical protein